MKKMFILLGQIVTNFIVITLLFFSVENVFNLVLEANIVLLIGAAYVISGIINQGVLVLLTFADNY